ncbi:Zn-finger nucleic acid-binding protein [Catenuloplanes atrovinosus]|uniref:Zn-finger nucleic acid-binding protein n=2 Tax=Catenuloplanes atrovinosus TaxID=137266 RepID=A0AAE3YXG4_9ACTN|nr:Zn-finger nucleic acid-binding protein [Catenuloplanes atrovinosus]
MTCPKCHGQMRQYERSGVTIDQCTECRGIFLDRGELEKLFEAEQNWSQRNPQGARPAAAPPPPPAGYPPAAPGHGGGYAPPPPPPVQHGYPAATPAYGHGAPAYGQGGYHGHYRHHGHRRNKRHRGFLGELFD